MRIENCSIGSIVLSTGMSFINSGETKNLGVRVRDGVLTFAESFPMSDRHINRCCDIVRIIKI